MDDSSAFETAASSGAQFARELNEPESESDRLSLAVDLIIELVEGCDHAGVMAASPQEVSTTAASSDLVRHADQLQYEFQQGPCLDSVRTQTTVVSGDLAADRRWPRWGPAVSERLGVHSVLSLLLYTHSDSYGSLNLYATSRHAYTPDDIIVAETLAAHLAVALASGRHSDHQDAALVSRTVIGQAEGILMERLRITAEQAFLMLRTTSQRENRKLVQIARELVLTGELPAGGRRRA